MMDTPPPEIGSRQQRSVLTEISLLEDGHDRSSVNVPPNYITPSASPDEMIIQKRGPRVVPVTWSPVEKITNINPLREKPPHKSPPIELRRSLRKRLILSPGKNPARNIMEQLVPLKKNKLDVFNSSFP